VLLAKRGKRVLLMDWDLEAPGLDRYFRPYIEEGFPQDRHEHRRAYQASQATAAS
jgi:Mrp family chromosome partitioning ATPase